MYIFVMLGIEKINQNVMQCIDRLIGSEVQNWFFAIYGCSFCSFLWQFHWGYHNRLHGEKLIKKRALKIWKFVPNIGILAIQRPIFTWKHLFFHQILQVTYIEDSKIMWNLKINFGTIFWDILTLHPHNSKSSVPTTGTFQ